MNLILITGIVLIALSVFLIGGHFITKFVSESRKEIRERFLFTRKKIKKFND